MHYSKVAEGCIKGWRTHHADTQAGTETTVEEWAVKRFEGMLVRVEREKKWDLNLVRPDHLELCLYSTTT